LLKSGKSLLIVIPGKCSLLVFSDIEIVGRLFVFLSRLVVFG
jgi:hypothetical protein